MKMQQVREMARRYGITSFSKTKVALVREIQRAEGNFECYGTAAGYCDQIDCCFRASCVVDDSRAAGSSGSRSKRKSAK